MNRTLIKITKIKKNIIHINITNITNIIDNNKSNFNLFLNFTNIKELKKNKYIEIKNNNHNLKITQIDNLLHFTGNFMQYNFFGIILNIFHDFTIESKFLYNFINDDTKKQIKFLNYMQAKNKIVLNNINIKNILTNKLLKTALKKFFKKILIYKIDLIITSDNNNNDNFIIKSLNKKSYAILVDTYIKVKNYNYAKKEYKIFT